MNTFPITLFHLDGRKFYTGWFEDIINVWARIVEVAANEFSCSQDEISLLETDEGDMICVGYREVARIEGYGRNILTP